ncbi:ketosteroid isomerase-like protein [Arthrobacter sp. UYP6]|uniref:nuclear transport factor 2 family protein n=1 Tax=Arthrobacter sp. UYP6 TaxID=1756378 RepID=UPI003391B1AB
MNSHHQVDQLTEGEVLAAAEELVTAFSRTDTDAYFAAFAPDATFVFYSEAQRLESRGDYEALWKGWLAEGWSVVRCESTNARVQLCGTSAVFSHTVETTTQTGGVRDTTREQETIVFARLDDGGRIVAVHEHLSLRLPAGDAA